MILFEPVVNAPKDTKMPIRKTRESAGYDFCIPKQVTIPANKLVVVKTNVKALMPRGWVLFLIARSSLFKKHKLIIPGAIGVIDSDYYGNPDNNGNIGIPLLNMSNEDVILTKNECVAQGVFLRHGITDDDSTMNVRIGGFGSTDRGK